jgi:putative protein kinase ArgK-like GTPase of G3E family
MLSTAGGRIERSPPKVLVTTATTGAGVADLVDAIDADRSRARSPLEARERAESQVGRALADLARRRASQAPGWEPTLEAVANRELDPLTAAERLLDNA